MGKGIFVPPTVLAIDQVARNLSYDFDKENSNADNMILNLKTQKF